MTNKFWHEKNEGGKPPDSVWYNNGQMRHMCFEFSLYMNNVM